MTNFMHAKSRRFVRNKNGVKLRKGHDELDAFWKGALPKLNVANEKY